MDSIVTIPPFVKLLVESGKVGSEDIFTDKCHYIIARVVDGRDAFFVTAFRWESKGFDRYYSHFGNWASCEKWMDEVEEGKV